MPGSRGWTAAFPFTRPVSASRLPPWAVAPIWQAALARRLALRRVRHRTIRVAPGDVVGPRPPLLEGLPGPLDRDEAVAAVADEVLPPRLHQRLPNGEVVLR